MIVLSSKYHVIDMHNYCLARNFVSSEFPECSVISHPLHIMILSCDVIYFFTYMTSFHYSVKKEIYINIVGQLYFSFLH